MYPQTHFLVALLLGEILVRLNVLGYKWALAAAFLAVLIDLDHWISVIAYHQAFGLRKAWNTALIEHGHSERTFIHHKVGFFLVTVFLAVMLFFSMSIFWVTSIAYYSHLFLDYVHVIGKKHFKFKELGFLMNITGFELVLDFVLILGIILLLV